MVDSMMSYRSASSAAESPGLRQPSWISELDLTEADLPYIRPMLADAFADWLKEADGYPWLPGSLGIVHPDGTAVVSREGEGIPACWTADRLGDNAFTTASSSCRPAIVRADEHTAPPMKRYDTVAVPLFTRSLGSPFAYIVSLLPAGTAEAGNSKLLQAAALHYRSNVYRLFESLFLRGVWREQKRNRLEQKGREVLFEVMRRLNGYIDVEDVLSEVLECLDRLYSHCRTDLYLSQDYSSANEKVKPLAFHELEMDLCRHAFLDGQMRQIKSSLQHTVALPLTGKQGVYGVLRLEAADGELAGDDLRFLTMLAAAAGAAFEKAKLHEHANTLIGELRIINELAQQLNRSLKLADTLEFANAEMLHIFAADYCCILQWDGASERFVAMTANVPELIGETYDSGHGFCGVMMESKEPIILSDYRLAAPVPSRFMQMTNARSLLAAPLLLNGDLIGAVMVGHRQPNHFSYDNYKLLQVLTTHLGLAMSNATLHAEVRRMVITDHLTGLFTRHYLNERIGSKLDKDGCGSLILVDIDHFKQVNDTFGHQVGDSILIKVGQIVRSSIRDSDIAARWGGEELAIYLPQLGLEQTMRVAERIRERVEAETEPRVSVSCGVAQWHSADAKISVEHLFYKADMALYEAKKAGRNRLASG